MLERYYRGYRLRLVDYSYIGGSGHPHDPSTWYPYQFDTNCAPIEEEFRTDAYTNYPSLYAWNPSALNVFLSVFPCGGMSAFCGHCSGGRLSDCIINGTHANASGGFTAEENFGARILHETGHYFSLTHTFGGTKCNTDTNGLCTAPAVQGDDEFTDTLRDVQNVGGCECWTVENLSWTNFNKGYGALSAPEKEQVDNVWYNLMSYHEANGYARLTEQQLDHWTDTANVSRRHVLSGVTIYVAGGSDVFSGLASSIPKRHVQAALNSADPGGGDVVLLRPGHYDERLTLSRPGTLRATRAGWATIGTP